MPDGEQMRQTLRERLQLIARTIAIVVLKWRYSTSFFQSTMMQDKVRTPRTWRLCRVSWLGAVSSLAVGEDHADGKQLDFVNLANTEPGRRDVW